MRKFPVAGFRPIPVDLFEVLHTMQEPEMAKALGVNPWAFRRWLDGEEPVPLIAYKLAKVIAGHELTAGFGEFAGVRYENGKLYARNRVGKRAGMTYGELSSIEMMRDLINNIEAVQAENMRLRKERDFYKGQCDRETRFGLIVNDLFNH
ncbi:MAG: hypothetical protein P4L87_16960 [Formivibrio sp.]|nr:hypothetical protein [Formivibrio sp.]MDR3539821.1 hypothetical protein [Desulfosporosinus sp.]